MSKKPEIKTWKDINTGGWIESGTSEHFKTGDWRSKVPIWQEKNCIQCMQCFAFCPDDAIKVTAEGKRTGYDYGFCKGCGICAEECPITAKTIKELQKKGPNVKIDAWDGAKNPEYAEKAAILMVSIKEAKEKHNIK
ncbi:MAG TPA: 4Fe-4S dicluster domain-containing protein [bacterium]|nr:4Fe-4S dicluster domain-containing protein [bacterium]